MRNRVLSVCGAISLVGSITPVIIAALPPDDTQATTTTTACCTTGEAKPAGVTDPIPPDGLSPLPAGVRIRRHVVGASRGDASLASDGATLIYSNINNC